MIYPRPLCQRPFSVMEEEENSGHALTSPNPHPSLTPYKTTGFPRITVMQSHSTPRQNIFIDLNMLFIFAHQVWFNSGS